MDQEVIDYCYALSEKELIKDWSRKRTTNPVGWGASFARVSRKDGVLSNNLHLQAACHGGLNHVSTETKASCVAIITLAGNYKSLKEWGWTGESIREYYRYIANDGPMAHMFVTKAPDEMIEKGIIIDPTQDLGGHLLMSLIQTRQPWELAYKSKITTYTYLFMNGVNHQLAYLLTMMSKWSGEKLYSFEYRDNIGTNHSPYGGFPLSLTGIRKLLKGIPNNPDGNPYLEGGYFGVFKLFYDTLETESGICSSLQRKLKQLLDVKPTPVQPKPINPFEKLAAPEVVDYTLEDQLASIIDFLLLFQKEIMEPVKSHTWDKETKVA